MARASSPDVRAQSPDGRAQSPDGRALPRSKRPIQRYRRYQDYDYSRGAALFITVSTSPRADLFGRVVEAKMELSPLGAEVLESIEAIPRFNSGFVLHGHVVMPDHGALH